MPTSHTPSNVVDTWYTDEEHYIRHQTEWISIWHIQVGSLVKVLRHPYDGEAELASWNNTWTEEMNRYIYMVCRVLSISDFGLELVICGEEEDHEELYAFPYWVLTAAYQYYKPNDSNACYKLLKDEAKQLINKEK